MPKARKTKLDAQTVQALTDPDPIRFVTMALAALEQTLLETVQAQAHRYLRAADEPLHEDPQAVSEAMKILLERFAKRADELAKKPAETWTDIAV